MKAVGSLDLNRKRIVLAALVMMLPILLANSRHVSAHAEFLDSTPAPGSALGAFPPEIELRFSEAIDPELSSVIVLAADGGSVAVGEPQSVAGDSHAVSVQIPDAESVDPGTYTVVWRAYSAEDDHTSSGSYTFSAGTGVAPVQAESGSARPSSAAVAGKWLELIGVVLVTGVAFFAATSGLERRHVSAAFTTIFGILAAIGLVGALVSIRAREAAIAGGQFIDIVHRGSLEELLRSTYGLGWIVRVTALMLIIALALLRRSRNTTAIDAAIVVLGIAAIVSIGATGHAGSARSSATAMAVDSVHMGGAAVWLGGLLGLLAAVPSRDAWAGQRALLRKQGNRFVIAVLAIVTAGVATSWFHLGGRRELAESSYGRTLLIKVVIVVVMLGVAFFNRRVLQGERPNLEWVPVATGAELALALFVLLFSADLSLSPTANGPRPVTVAARAISVDATSEGAASTVDFAGVVTGDPSDRISITVQPTSDLQRVIVRTSLTNRESGISIGDRFDADPDVTNEGEYSIPAGRLGLAGEWTVDVIVRRAGVPDETASFLVDTSGLAGRSTRLDSDQWGGFRPDSHTALALGLAVLMVIVGLGGLKRVTGLEPLASGFLLAASLLIAGGFLVSAARSLVPVTPEHRQANPAPTDNASLTYAADLYQLNCAACHGVNGRGVGSSNIAHLHGDGADMTRSRTVDQSDGDLRFWVGNGVPGTEMPAFSPALSEDEQWLLVRYIRQLQEAARIEDETE